MYRSVISMFGILKVGKTGKTENWIEKNSQTLVELSLFQGVELSNSKWLTPSPAASSRARRWDPESYTWVVGEIMISMI